MNPPNGSPRQMTIYQRPTNFLEPAMFPDGGDKDSDGLASYWYVLSKRRWSVLVVTLAVTALVILYSYHMTPIYRATAHLEIEPETPMLQSVNDIYQRFDADDPFMQTQIQVLKGENVEWQTIGKLSLFPTLGVIPREKLTKEEIEKHKLEFIETFDNRVKVELLPKTRLLSVGYESPDPELSAKVVTTLVNSYLDNNFQQKYDAIGRSGWLEQQLAELKDKVEKSQQALVDYEQLHQIANTGINQSPQEQMLSDLSHDLITARADRIQKESLNNQVVHNRSELASLAHDELLQILETRSSDLKGQYAEAIAQYGPKYPKATRLQLQIDEQQALIEHEQNRVIDRVHNDYTAAQEREQLAQRAVADQKAQVGKLSQLLVQDNILQHEFQTNQQLYQSLLQRVKDASLSAGLRSTNIHLVDSALAPVDPVRPKKLIYGLVALMAGLMLGVMAAFGQDKMDSSVRTSEEAEALMVTPAIGAIPFERDSRPLLRKLALNGRASSLALNFTKRPHSSLSEAFRALGTAVSLPADASKTLLITSAQDGDGKTVTTLNLAQALAKRKGPVLVIDCDLRRGGIAESLGIPNGKGLSTVLSGEHDVSEALQQMDAHSSLWVLASGPVPPNPAELLASPKMKTILDTMAARFAFVILDSPPVLAVTDATILSTIVDRVLLVAASGSTPRNGLIRTRKILSTAGAQVLGIVVNKLDPRFQSYSSYHYVYSSNRRSAKAS